MRRAFNPKDPTKNRYLKLVRSDGRITSEDLKLLFEKDLEHTSSYWIFAVGALVGILTFALGNVIALGLNALSTYVGRVATVVSLTAFAGITLFLYVINWEMVSGIAFRYWIEARSEIEARTKTAQTPTQSQSESQIPQSSNVSETPATTPGPREFDKEIELKKLDLVSEELRTRFFTAVGVYFALGVAIIAGLLSFGLTQTTSKDPVTEITLIGLGLVVVTIAVVSVVIRQSVEEYKGQLSRLDDLIEDIEKRHSIDTVRKALERIKGRR